MSAPGQGPVAVLGAGPTGLGVAFGIGLHQPSRKVLVLEKAARPGGLAGSFAWKGHRIDHGPHRLSPNIGFVRSLAEDLLGPDLLRLRSQGGVWLSGRCFQFPPRVVDWARPLAAWQLARFSASFAAAKLSWIVRRFEPDSFESMIVRKFGRAFYREIAAPMAAKVWTDPAEIDPAFVDQRFAHVRPGAVLKRWILPRQELNPSICYYPRLGFQQLWDRLAESVGRGGHAIRLGTVPTAVEVRDGRIVRLEHRGPEGAGVLEGDGLEVVSTIPLSSLARLLAPWRGDLPERADRIRIRSLILACFEIDRPRALPFRQIHFPEASFRFNRLFEQNAYSPDTVEAGRSVVVADITVPRGDPLPAQADGEILRQVREDLRRVRGFPIDRIVDETVRRVEFAYPVPDLASRRELHLLLRDLEGIRNLHVAGRFGAGEYDNSDYALDNGFTLAEHLAGRIGPIEHLRRTGQKRNRPIVG